MARRKSNTSQPHSTPATPKAPGWVLWLGSLALLTAAGASGMLVYQHFTGISLPGCGPGSPCAQAAASVWGKVPALGWPTSFVGLAYFLGALAGWVAGRGRLPIHLVWVVRLGAVASVFFLGVAIVEHLICVYCIVAQGGNLVFLGMVEVSRRIVGRVTGGWQFPAGFATFICVGAILLSAGTQARQQAAVKAEEALSDSTARLTAQISTDTTSGTDSANATDGAQTPVVLAGRYRLGPELSPIRIVMFTDYQCPDCKLLEAQLFRLVDEKAPISVTIRHFPFSSDCNPHSPRRMHANACWASRAAEAAGMIGGSEAFWRMHRWLFERGGSFTDEQLREGVRALGLGEPRAFEQIMTGAQTLARVKGDIDDAVRLGIYNTPFIFINGVELRGWTAPDALVRTVQAMMESLPPPGAGADDRPPDAAEKQVEDWRRNPVVAFPAGLLRHGKGPEESPVTIVMFGDYAEDFTGQADAVIRLFTSGTGPTVRYYFVPFPVDRSCNPAIPETKYPDACARALAAEAADMVGGPEAFWAMHDYLMSNQRTFTPEGARVAAMGAGVDAAQYDDAISQPFLGDPVASDCQAALNLGLTSIPMIFVNGKHLPRWRAGNENIIPRVIYAAEEEARAAHAAPTIAPDQSPK